MKRAMAVLGSLVLIGLLAPAPSAAQDALTKRDGRGPVAVTVALLESPAVGSPVRVRVALDTHSVGLDGITFGEAVAIRAPDGADVPPASVERTSGGGHHREPVPPKWKTSNKEIRIDGETERYATFAQGSELALGRPRSADPRGGGHHYLLGTVRLPVCRLRNAATGGGPD